MNKGGRPRIEFDKDTWKQIEGMCEIHCTGEEIAGVLDIDYDTLNARVKDKYTVGFSDYYKRHQGKGKASLRRLQWEAAETGNTTMLVWLGKNVLDQTDKQEVSATIKNTTVLQHMLDQLE